MNTLAICPHCATLNRLPIERTAIAQPTCGRCKTELRFEGPIQELDDAALKAFIEKSPLPIVVDFWAPWCGPCRAFAPTYKQAAKELAGRAVLTKLDTDAYPTSGTIHRIRGIPTLVVFKNGRELNRVSGALPFSELLQYLRQWIDGAKAA